MLSRKLKTQFVAAIRRMLRPVIRQLIAYGVTYPAFNQIVKQLFVEVAEHDFPLAFKRQTDSRLALVTGLNRKEVAQLRQRAGIAAPAAEIEDTLVTHVIGRWMSGPPYASPDGMPRALRYESEDPQVPTFQRLVRELGVDIPVRAVLDELLRIGSAHLYADGTVMLTQEAFIPPADTEGKLALIGSDPAEVFSTIVHNIEQADAPWLQRKVVYDHIGADALGALQVEARRLGEEFIRRANALLASYDHDRHPDAPGGPRHRVVLGSYYFQEPVGRPVAGESADGRKHPPGRIRRSR